MVCRMKYLALSLLFLIPLFASDAHASERPDHYLGEPSATLEEALRHYAETNQRIDDLLSKGDLDPTDLAAVHELTYTLENALARIDEEYERLAEQLEELHLASEGADVARARALGERYLENARRFEH